MLLNLFNKTNKINMNEKILSISKFLPLFSFYCLNTCTEDTTCATFSMQIKNNNKKLIVNKSAQYYYCKETISSILSKIKRMQTKLNARVTGMTFDFTI